MRESGTPPRPRDPAADQPRLAMAGHWCEQIAVSDQGRLVEQAPSQRLSRTRAR